MSEIELFFKLEQELKIYKKIMGEASDIVMKSDVSNYPIFVVHQQDINIGIPIASREKVSGNWSINATTLEELVAKNLIKERRIDNFRKNFKSPDSFLCLFVLSELGAQFIFLPRS